MNLNFKLFVFVLFIVLAIIYFDLFINNYDPVLVEEFGFFHNFFCDLDDCKAVLGKLINNSFDLKCAFYDLSDVFLIDLLIEQNADVVVHNVPSAYSGSFFFEKINTFGLMHHKFCVINRSVVVTGSFNPTLVNNHFENLVVFNSSTIASNYLFEFEQLKLLNNKEISVKERTSIGKILFNDYYLENYFCPQDDCSSVLVNKILNAQERVYFLLFTFTDVNVANALIEKSNEGLDVLGIVEGFQNKRYWVVPLLEDNNVSLKVHSGGVFQHNKVFIIDDVVFTGSFNPTASANTVNDENILVIGLPFVVDSYVDYFLGFFDSLS